jgi:murein DD-endopeptidase MepM/ murein hydrolase activator NlpD
LQARANHGCKARRNASRSERRAALAATASAVAILCATAGVASAQEADEPTSSGDVAAQATGGSSADGGSEPGDGSGSGELRLRWESANPGKVFFNGTKKARYRYAIAGRRSRDLIVKAVRRRSGKVVRTWRRDNVEPRSKHSIRWAGTNRQGRGVRKGKYVFRVRERGGGAANRSSAKGSAHVRLLPYKFPVRGGHQYWDGYGAGRGHQGQDLGSRCAARVVAARAGRVQWRGYQASGAGYYLVIDGKGTGNDYVYMHLRRKHRPKEGKRVRTGQSIGRVGLSGNSSDCHLHFEIWSRPGWYEGGHAMRSVTRRLRQWDGWS